MQKITTDEAMLLIQYIDVLSGISLDINKSYLLESRLCPLLSKLECANYGELYNKAKMDRTNNINNLIISAISTNETFFFRDANTFDLFKFKILPDLFDYKTKNNLSRSLKIWSAACSNGQEVYSIAIALKELLLGDIDKWNINILGTDISDAAVMAAGQAKYSQLEVDRGLSLSRRSKYFTLKDEKWEVIPEMRSLATFKKINLLKPLNFGMFDVVFCRNVAIYFTPENRTLLFERIAATLNPMGSLLVGSTESMANVTSKYKRSEYNNAVMYNAL